MWTNSLLPLQSDMNILITWKYSQHYVIYFRFAVFRNFINHIVKVINQYLLFSVDSFLKLLPSQSYFLLNDDINTWFFSLQPKWLNKHAWPRAKQFMYINKKNYFKYNNKNNNKNESRICFCIIKMLIKSFFILKLSVKYLTVKIYYRNENIIFD